MLRDNAQCSSLSCFRMWWRGSQTGNFTPFTFNSCFSITIICPLFLYHLLFLDLITCSSSPLWSLKVMTSWPSYRKIKVISSFLSSCFYQHWVDKTSSQNRKGKVLSHQVQFGTKATAEEYRKWHKIVKLVIHPDYWQVSPPASNIKKTKCFDTGTKWSCPTPWCGPGNDWEWGYCMIFQKVMDCHNKISKS